MRAIDHAVRRLRFTPQFADVDAAMATTCSLRITDDLGRLTSSWSDEAQAEVVDLGLNIRDYVASYCLARSSRILVTAGDDRVGPRRRR